MLRGKTSGDGVIKLGLRIKFNLVLVLAWSLGAGIYFISSAQISENIARDEVMQTARTMMESASGVWAYTADEVAPILRSDMTRTFHPQSVGSYSAKKDFAPLHAKNADFTYRAVALNPTNLEDRPMDWEADIVNAFRSHPEQAELVLERQTATGPTLNLAIPVVNRAACVECHSTPNVAPASMRALYGSMNGFGWKVGDIVGAQIVTVPLQAAQSRSATVRLAFFWPFVVLFVVLLVLVNLVLELVIIRPVEMMSSSAERVSKGEIEAPEYARSGADQISRLSNAINLLRRSLREAMKMLD